MTQWLFYLFTMEMWNAFQYVFVFFIFFNPPAFVNNTNFITCALISFCLACSLSIWTPNHSWCGGNTEWLRGHEEIKVIAKLRACLARDPKRQEEGKITITLHARTGLDARRGTNPRSIKANTRASNNFHKLPFIPHFFFFMKTFCGQHNCYLVHVNTVLLWEHNLQSLKWAPESIFQTICPLWEPLMPRFL